MKYIYNKSQHDINIYNAATGKLIYTFISGELLTEKEFNKLFPNNLKIAVNKKYVSNVIWINLNKNLTFTLFGVRLSYYINKAEVL